MNDRPLRTLTSTIIFIGLTSTSEGQWTTTSIPHPISTYSITTAGEKIFVGTDSGVYYSLNGGTSWQHPSNTGLGASTTIYSLAMNDSFLFAGTSSGGVFRSTDYGSGWEAANTGIPTVQTLSLTLGDSGILAGTNKGVYLSKNNGIVWQARNTGMLNRSIWELAIAHDAAGSEILFAGASGGAGVFRSMNNGVSWEHVSHGWVDSSIWALAVDEDSNIYAGTETAGVYYSGDMGSTWVRRGLTNQSVQGLVVVPDSAAGREKLLAGTYGSGVFGSFDTGKTWFTVNFGLLGLNVNALAANSTHAFAGLQPGGVFRNLLHDMLDPVGEETERLPVGFTLEQNYPNPFNPTTSIEFHLTDNSAVTLVVSDLNGRDVATLLDGRRMNAGRQSVEFDASGMASGIYLCRIVTRDQGGGLDRKVRKMVLLK